MRYLDEEMSGEERREFERHITECDECRIAVGEFRELQALTRRITMKDPTDEFWEGYWKSIYRRLERRFAWWFVIIGAVMLLSNVLYKVLQDFGRLTFEKLAVVVFIVGAVLLLISVVRERIHQRKTDKYKDIQR
jgi:anti-sigma factor RsiW